MVSPGGGRPPPSDVTDLQPRFTRIFFNVSGIILTYFKRSPN